MSGGHRPSRRSRPRCPARSRRCATSALVWGGDDRLRLVRTARDLLAPSASTPSPTGLGPTVAEATAGMSPGRLQEILADAGLAATHDPVSAVAALRDLFADRARMASLLVVAPAGQPPRCWTGWCGARRTGRSRRPRPVRGRRTRPPRCSGCWPADCCCPPGRTTSCCRARWRCTCARGARTATPEPVAPAVEPLAVARPRRWWTRRRRPRRSPRPGTVEELLKAWQTGGPQVLRAGGLSVRDLRRTAATLDVGEQQAAFWLETRLRRRAARLGRRGRRGVRAHSGVRRVAAAARRGALGGAGRRPGCRRPARRAWSAARDAKGAHAGGARPGPGPLGARRRCGAGCSNCSPELPPGASASADGLLARLRWERPHRGAAGPDELRARLVRLDAWRRRSCSG